MSAVATRHYGPLDVTRLAAVAAPPLEAILSASGPAFMGVLAPGGDRPERSVLRDRVDRAQAFLDLCAAHADLLREAVEPLALNEVGRQVGAFVTAWPNASSADLAGYGAQLVEDVIERRPCRYSLRSALRHLRQTSRFLPAIAEVLAALDGAQARIRNTAWHAARIPAELDAARAALAAVELRQGAASGAGAT